MPIVEMSADRLLELVNRGCAGRRVDLEELVRQLPRLGCAVEAVAEVQEYACRACGKVFAAGASQGPPSRCTVCGTDLSQPSAAPRELGTARVLRLELLAVRADLFDPGGMARLIRAYLGIEPGLTEAPVDPGRLTVRVDPRLAEPRSYRPFIACAVVRDIVLDAPGMIPVLMNLQEDLHWALGRNRKLASIGMYDLETLGGTRLRYEAAGPDEVSFVPLGCDPAVPGSAMTPREVLERHGKGREYAHLLSGMERYPLLRDESGQVLSMPPIINSQATRVTARTRHLLVDVTGISRRSVERALAIVVCNLHAMQPEARIESVCIEEPAGQRITPDLTPARVTLRAREVSATIGVELSAEKLAGLLERMGHSARVTDEEVVDVRVPAYRNDVMHPVDLIEDAAIAYGYDHLPAALVPTFTIGRPLEVEEQSAIVRRILTGLGFHQVMTLTLTSAAALERWGLAVDERAVQIENPISVEQTMCRVSVLPGLLETLALNKQYELPQRIFEVGDIARVDPEAETGAREERILGAAMIGTHVGYADIRAVADAVTRELSIPCSVRPLEHPGLIAGRGASLHGPDGGAVGILGEVHPQVIENYGLRHPVAVLEVNLSRLLAGGATAGA